MKQAPIALALLTLLAGCGGSKLQLKTMPYDGQNHFLASKDQIIKKLEKTGNFESTYTSNLDKDYDVVRGKDDTQFFLKDGKVVSFIHAPSPQETKLIYWRYKFKGHLYRDTEMPSDGLRGHHLPQRQLASDDLGLGIIYDANTDAVTRVFHYDKK